MSKKEGVLIEAKDLRKVYGDSGVETVALRDVSLEIEKGEFVAIMGPSGSGKSTLLHILGFLDRPSAGTYRFDGKTMEEYTDDELAHVRNQKMGFVFQAFNLLPRTTVLENIKLPLLYSKVPSSDWLERAKRAATSVGLVDRLNHESSQLSGGEKQRVAIARALVLNPQVIFADEPTGNLDSASGKAILEILENMNKEERTVVLVTHETYTAEHARRVVRISDGKIESDKRNGQGRLSDGFEK